MRESSLAPFMFSAAILAAGLLCMSASAHPSFAAISTAVDSPSDGSGPRSRQPIREWALDRGFERMQIQLRRFSQGRGGQRSPVPNWAIEAMVHLAESGSGPAARWCLTQSGLETDHRLTGQDVDDLRVDWHRTAVTVAKGSSLSSGFQSLLADNMISDEGRIQLLQEFAGQAYTPEVRALAEWSIVECRKATISSEFQDRIQAARSIARRYPHTRGAGLAQEDADSLTAAVSRGQVPDFVALDSAGNQVRLTDFRGQVVVVHFTDPSGQGVAADVALAKAMTERYWDDRFTWITIHRSGNQAAIETAVLESGWGGVCGLHVFEGRADESAGTQPAGATRAWQMVGRGRMFIVDPRGQLAAVANAGGGVRLIIDELLENLALRSAERHTRVFEQRRRQSLEASDGESLMRLIPEARGTR